MIEVTKLSFVFAEKKCENQKEYDVPILQRSASSERHLPQTSWKRKGNWLKIFVLDKIKAKIVWVILQDQV